MSQSDWRWGYYIYFTIFACKSSFTDCLGLKAPIYTTGQFFYFSWKFLIPKGYINCNYIQLPILIYFEM